MKTAIRKLITGQSDIVVGNTTADDHSLYSLYSYSHTPVYKPAHTKSPTPEYTPYSREQFNTGEVDCRDEIAGYLLKEVFDSLSIEAKKRLPKDLFIVTKDAGNQPVKRFGRRKIWSVIERVFSDPKHHCKLLIDFLEITIDLNTKQSDRLIQLLIEWSVSSASVKSRKIKNPKGIGYRKKFIIKDSQGSCITIFYKPYRPGERNATKRKCGNYTRLIKLSFNPSKVNVNQLQSAISLFKQACCRHFKSLILEAAITRLDVTVDIKGIQPIDFISRKKGCSISARYCTEDGQVLTISEGAGGCNRLNIYDKSEQLAKLAEKRGDLKKAKKLRSKPNITRVEVTVRPHRCKKSKGLTINSIHKLQGPFEDVEIYDEEKLLNDPNTSKLVRAIKNYGLNFLVKRLSRAGVNQLKRHLSKSLINVEHEELWLMQYRELRKVRVLLLGSKST